MGVPLDEDGVPAAPGTTGRWLTQPSDVLGSDDMSTRLAREGEALSVSFPRDWPTVFKQSTSLKGLVKALRAARARAAMQEESRCAVRLAVHLIVECVQVADGEHAGAERIAHRVERARVRERWG